MPDAVVQEMSDPRLNEPAQATKGKTMIRFIETWLPLIAVASVGLTFLPTNLAIAFVAGGVFMKATSYVFKSEEPTGNE